MREMRKQEAREAALADGLRAKAFGITPENVDEVIEKRSH
ncbi:glycerate kinase, partial [Nostoc sp. CHAB 5715]|nr:glycerate kinase [Nostoc sp. CHAB 5715]